MLTYYLRIIGETIRFNVFGMRQIYSPKLEAQFYKPVSNENRLLGLWLPDRWRVTLIIWDS